MRVWKEKIPEPEADANEIIGQTVYLLTLNEYRGKYVSRSNKIYYVTEDGKFGFWIDPKTKSARLFGVKDQKAKETFERCTEEKKIRR